MPAARCHYAILHRSQTRTDEIDASNFLFRFLLASQELRSAILGPDDHPRAYKTASVAAAETVGKMFGVRARARGIEAVTWSRPGRYHGKIKGFIDNVRASGIQTLQAHPRESPPKPAVNN
jgi:hypothetical protein